MIVFPSAKINLGLKVLNKRSDGYHNICSVFYPVPLCDALEVIENQTDGEDFKLTMSGIKIVGTFENNLIYKAWLLIKKQFELPKIQVHLHKVIPMGAGLGGGSADGAYMLKLLNEKFKLNLSVSALKDLAAKLGSDCPFFIEEHPSAVTGRGEIMKPISLQLKNQQLKIIHPNIHVSTAEAYRLVEVKDVNYPIEEIIVDSSAWKKNLVNDFQTAIAKKHPEINVLIENLYREGAYYAAMSGSGSAVFGLFDEGQQCEISPDQHFQWIGKLN